MYSLGAIQKDTGEYILPKDAQKGIEYSCMDCQQKVIFRKGGVRRAHFAHYSPTNTCSYYEHPNESQIHKDAKYKFASWLCEQKNIVMEWQCNDCKCFGAGEVNDEFSHKILYDESDEVVVEYRDVSNRYVADIAVLNNNKIKYVFEILHTHKTTTNVRPEPWFEIDTEQIFEYVNENKDEIWFICRRNSLNRTCEECKAKKEPWVHNIPKLVKKVGIEGKWCQSKSCIKCGRHQYSPLWVNGPRQICKICFSHELDSLRNEYSSQNCMMIDD